ncbi:hydroxyethylthiazole kinase [Desulfovibrio sp. An276]|nr:hydroxyethylthiazole kinase [Desulfovibrio sp. An276]
MTREEVLSTILKAVSRSGRAKKAFAQGAYLGHFLERVREARPLVHFITNFVTVNDCANITLATGASPIMADAPEEMAEVTSICDALVINMGTLNARTAASMVAAGKAASKAGHVVVFDPVGAGVSALRNETAHNILQEVRPTLIRGNLSEIRYLALGLGGSHGVDAAQGDSVTIDNIHTHADMILHFARRQQCVVVASGPIDIVSDGRKVFCVHNGCSFMGRITGTGCMASGVLAAFAAAGRDRLFEAAVAATVCMGVAGEMAARRLKKGEGTGSFRTYLLDAVSCLKPRELDRQARLECLAPEKGGEGNVD